MHNRSAYLTFLALAGLMLGAFAALPAKALNTMHTDFVLFGDADAQMNALPAAQQFVHPVTAPYFHENSFVTTDIRAWYVYHQFEGDGVANGGIGGDVTVVAVQARLALTDRFQLVAYKDGYVWFEDSAINDEGWNDIAAGIKYQYYRDIENQLYAAAGIGYEFGWGDNAVLQSDDELRLWFSVDKGFDKLHLGATFNYFYPTGEEETPFGDAERISWHIHADYHLTEWFSPVVEFNGYHTIDASSTAAVPFTGVDVANLGGGESNDTVTMGVGGEFRIPQLGSAAIRAAYEFHLTDDPDLFGDRFTVSAVWSF